MKKNLNILILVLALFSYSYSQQNLVLNPSFEIYTNCPNNGAQINKATNWDSYRATPDYFNSCATYTDVTVPKNFFGYQQPFNGNAYSGFYTYDNNGLYREILGVQLANLLTIGQKYFISFKVNRAYANSIITYATNNIGIKLSKVKQPNVAINNSAHFNYTSVITDTLAWTKISGSFLADSAYQYLMIGNFFDDINTLTVNTGSGTIGYYFLDDVCLSTDSIFCQEYVTNVSEQNSNSNVINVFPNPSDKFFTIETPLIELITVTDVFGKIVYQISAKQKTIDSSNWDQGLYIIIIGKKKYKLFINH